MFLRFLGLFNACLDSLADLPRKVDSFAHGDSKTPGFALLRQKQLKAFE